VTGGQGLENICNKAVLLCFQSCVAQYDKMWHVYPLFVVQGNVGTKGIGLPSQQVFQCSVDVLRRTQCRTPVGSLENAVKAPTREYTIWKIQA
jgi:hypothetical protein